MKRALLALVLALAGCGEKPRGTSAALKPIAGAVALVVRADPEFGTSFYAALSRDGGDPVFRVAPVKNGEKTVLSWTEAVDRPREWRLKFGPSRHPTYLLALLPDRGAPPQIGVKERDGLHDPKNALAIAYFAIPLDGERPLEIELKKTAPFAATVTDAAGKPLVGVAVMGVATPRYLFLDGFDPAAVDEMHVSWAWDFTNFDLAPNFKGNRERMSIVRTDAAGTARFDGLVGWVGLPQKSAPLAQPRNVLAMPELRSTAFIAALDPAKIRLTAQGLPARDHYITQRGLVAEGVWELPGGPLRWEEQVRFVTGDVVEFLTPCRELKLRPVSEVHAVTSGAVIEGVKEGETRRHKVVLEEPEHLTIEGEVLLEERGKAGREYCSIDLHGAGPALPLLQSVGPRGSQGVAASGRVPFLFHVKQPGPYTIIVKAGHYPAAVVHDVKAPREELRLRLQPETKNVPCAVDLPGGFMVGSWPQRELLSSFVSGGDALGKPGLNTFIVTTETGSGVLRDVSLVEGGAPTLKPVLGPGTAVAGRVVDAAGKPVAGAWVHLSWHGYLKMPHAYRWLADRTDVDGRFEIAKIPPGPWRLYARGSGLRIGGLLTVPEGAKTLDVGILSMPGGSP